MQSGQEHIPTLPTGDGGEWWGAVQGYSTGQTPQLGAVACYAQAGQAGHVAIVEEINGDEITLSNSGYPDNFFWVSHVNKANNYLETTWMGSDWTFQGFIYNPYACASTPQPIPESKQKMPLWMYLFL